LVNLVASIQTTLVFFFFLVLLRVVARNRWVAAALFVLLFSASKVLGSDHPMIEVPMWLIIYSIAAVAVVRFGLIVLAVGIVMVNVLLNLPYTLDFSRWYAARALGVVLGFVVLAFWGFYTSLAGQRLWKEELFD
jgi:general stress protein CsbA